MRIPNSTIVRNYTHTLSNNLNRLNRCTDQVMTGRRFSAGYEDPASAVRAMNIRRSLSRIDSYKDNVKTLQSKYDAAETTLGQLSNRCVDVQDYFNNALNGTNDADEYKVFAANLTQLRDEMIDLINGRFAGNYLFGGTNVSNDLPFQRTVVAGSSPPEYQLTYNGKNIFDIAQGDPCTTDNTYVDIGLDMQVNMSTGAIASGTAFDSSLRAIDYLGLGEDNLVYILDNMITALESGNFNPNEHGQLLTSFQQATNRVNLGLAQMGADTNYLKYTYERLENEEDNLIKRQDAIEFVNSEEAIMSLKMQEYVYNAALQMGTRLLQPSLFNFLS